LDVKRVECAVCKRCRGEVEHISFGVNYLR